MSDERGQVLKTIATYLGLTTLLCAIVYYMISRSQNMVAPPGSTLSYGLMAMWCPGVAALITCRIRAIDLGDLGWSWRPVKYQWWAYGLPIAYTSLAYAFVWVSGLGGFYNHEFVTSVAKSLAWPLPDGLIIVLYILLDSAFGMVRAMALALGEEIGWRGLLVPQLAKISSYTTTSLVSGVIWSIYHYPLILTSNYNSGDSKWLSLACFTVMAVSACFIFTWLRLKSGNLWTAVVMHGSHNLFVQSIFTPLTVKTAYTPYLIDEFGVVLPALLVPLAYVFWRKRHELA